MSDRREAVRANAKYLRNVRPIDPEEICAYVEGSPHPGVVRQILREEAFELDLYERPDGTFEPVPDEPVPPRDGPIERFPVKYENRLEEVLTERYGPHWYEGASGDLLRSTIRRFKRRYLEGAPVEYDDDVAAGYAIYHLPGYYAAIQYALDDLIDRGLLGRRLRILDVGAGVGGPALGLIDTLPPETRLDYHAIEPGEGAAILEALLDETGPNVRSTIHRTRVESFDPADAIDASDLDSGFDLVLVCNVLSELTDPESVLRWSFEMLAPGGTVLAMAPADKRTSIELRQLERAVEGCELSRQFTSEESDANGTSMHDTTQNEVKIYSPSGRLWPGETPSDRGWSFDVRPDLAVPTFQRRLDRAATDDDHTPGEFVNVDVQFSYAIFRLDGVRRVHMQLDPDRWAKMAEMDRHVTNRIDLVAAKMSHSLSADEEGESQSGSSNPLFKISDGSESIDHYAVLTNETVLNRPLKEAEYGDVLAFEGGLVLWNDDEGAYNVIVDEETVVDRVA